MTFLTKYGTQWGAIPQTAGRVFWVAPSDGYTVDGKAYRASDENNGLSPEKALRRVNRAANLVTADVGDIVVLLPGAHTGADTSGTAESLAMDVAGVHWMGLPGGRGNYKRQKTSLAGVASNQTVNVTAANIEISYLHFIAITTDSVIDASAAADNLHVHNCSFDMETAVVNIGTIGIDYIGAASNGLIENCYFVVDGAQGPAVVAGATLGLEISNCQFQVSVGTWAACITQAAAGRELLVQDNNFDVGGTGAITAGCVGTGSGEAGMAMFYRNYGSDQTAAIATTYDANDAAMAENYFAGNGDGTDGGILYVALT